MTDPNSPSQQEARRIAQLSTFPDRRAAIRAFLTAHPQVDLDDFYEAYFFHRKRHDEDARYYKR